MPEIRMARCVICLGYVEIAPTYLEVSPCLPVSLSCAKPSSIFFTSPVILWFRCSDGSETADCTFTLKLPLVLELPHR